MPVPYTFGTATTSIPLSNLDANFNTPVTIGNATVGLGNTVTTVGNLTLTNATISSGNVTVTTGIFGAGSNTAPSITTTGDTNTGIFFPAADTIAFTEGGVESMRIDNSGNVGIGTSSPSVRLDVAGSGKFTGITEFTNSINLTTSTLNYLYFNDAIAFARNGVGERMRIDSSGNVGIGTSSPASKLDVVGALRLTNTANSANFGTLSDGGGLIITSANSNPMYFYTGGAERMRIDSSGNVFIGGTSGPVTGTEKLGVYGGVGAKVSSGYSLSLWNTASTGLVQFFTEAGGTGAGSIQATGAALSVIGGSSLTLTATGANAMVFNTNSAERMRIDSSGALLVGKTAQNSTVAGSQLNPTGAGLFTVDGSHPIQANRLTSDGDLVVFQQASVTEGTISVSGSTVSYNGGHLSRWSQLPDGSKDDTILKGTVLTNLDDMCVWEKEGVVADNEQLNKMKVSDVEGDTNVAGVFVNWTIDEQYGVDDMNVAMTGDMIIRIANGVVVQKGDLLMSAGDGTAKPQGDDIVRSKTIAKVTSNHITCTYADGSYCVPCVLMAC